MAGFLAPKLLTTWLMSAILFLSSCRIANSSPDPGIWIFDNVTNEENYLGVVKNVYANTELTIKISCSSNTNPDFKVRIGWMLRKTPCWEEYLAMNSEDWIFKQYYNNPVDPLSRSFYSGLLNNHTVHFVKPAEDTYTCNSRIQIPTFTDPPQVLQANSVRKLTNNGAGKDTKQTTKGSNTGGAAQNVEPAAGAPQEKEEAPVKSGDGEPAAPADGQPAAPADGQPRNLVNLNKVSKRDVNGIQENLPSSPTGSKTPPQYIIKHEGVYLLVVYVAYVNNIGPYSALVDIEFNSPSGYLSVADWPLLPFYGAMCGLYVLLGLMWLLVCSVHWRDLLRLQFWIGGVIFLGMVEKAMFTSEYQNINTTGQATQSLIVSAEIISCAKRTLARMLVIIVSLGFGIVKPRLGPTMSKVIAVGGLYFVLASVESVLRVVHPKNDPSNVTLMAAVPLAVIDASICWWVFSALIQTTRALRLRRNLVKLSVYRHFTNTLVFAVFSSIIFMLWSIKYHKIAECLTDWRDLWVDEAFWHLLFSVILVVIMVLWRPSQNNQRYAFTPLLDGDEDYSSDEDVLYNDAWEGMKMRGKSASRPDTPSGADPEEDPLAWVEENIAGIDPALPALDSEEELETTKVEISKLM